MSELLLLYARFMSLRSIHTNSNLKKNYNILQIRNSTSFYMKL